jgi:Family of unknown function (DUF5719)
MTAPRAPSDGPPSAGGRERGRRHSAVRTRRGRWAALLVVAVPIVAVAVLEAAFPASPAVLSAGPTDGVSVAAPGSYSSSAFCAGGTGTAASATVYLTNTTSRSVSGVMTATAPPAASGTASTAHRTISVPALGTAAVDPADGLPGGSNASMFTFAGGGVAVSQVVSGPTGWSTAPCASQTSAEWSFAGGSTAGGNLLTLSLLNPTATEAVVNVSFLTDGSVVVPQAYQGLNVPPGQLLTENVGDFVQNADDIATLVTAQTGTLVSTEFQQWSPGATGGLSLRLGSPGLATTWQFAQTTAMPGATVDFYLANPGNGPATATMTFGLSSGSVEPVRTVVAPRSVSVMATSSIPGLPRQVPYSVTVAADQPIVAGRSVLAPSGSAAPVWGSSSATVTTAGRWVVPGPGVPAAPGTAGAAIHSLAVADPGASPVQVSIARLGEDHPFTTFTVPAGGLSVLGANQVAGLATYLVSSSGPVNVEEDSMPAGSPGVVSSTGFPLLG